MTVRREFPTRIQLFEPDDCPVNIGDRLRSLILWPMRSNPAAKIYVKAEDALSDFLSFVIVHYSQRRFNVSFASLSRHLRQVSNDRVEFVARFDRQRFQPWPQTE